MLQLNSNNGKFDIVFTGDILHEQKYQKKEKVDESCRPSQKAQKSRILNPKKANELKLSKVNIHQNQVKRVNEGIKTIENHLRTNKLNDNKHHKNSQNNKTISNENANVLRQPKKAPNRNSSFKSNKMLNDGNADLEQSSGNTRTDNSRPQTYVRRSGAKNRSTSADLKKSNDMVKKEVSVITKDELDNLFHQFYEASDSVDKKPEISSSFNTSISANRNENIDKSASMTQENMHSRSSRDSAAFGVKEMKKRQLTPDIEYDPWGKPGGGAPLQQGTGNIKSALKRYNAAKVGDNRDRSQKSIKDSQIEERNNVLAGHNEMDPKVLKHLQHQEAIKAQVEEKRRRKQLEKEKMLEEDRKAEERFLKQQEILKKREEEELKQQREKEEKAKRFEQTLVESLQKAKEEVAKTKAETFQTKKDKAHLKDTYQREDDKFIHCDISEEDFDNSHKDMDQNIVSSEEKSNFSELESTHTKINIQDEHETNDYDHKTFNEKKMGNEKHRRDFKSRPSDDRCKEIIDDYLVPYRRSNTEILNPNRKIKDEYSKKNNIAGKRFTDEQIDKRFMKKGIEDRYFKDILEDGDDISQGSIITEYLTPINSPTSRQQQILDQLNNLRQGLMQKQQEYLKY